MRIIKRIDTCGLKVIDIESRRMVIRMTELKVPAINFGINFQISKGTVGIDLYVTNKWLSMNISRR